MAKSITKQTKRAFGGSWQTTQREMKSDFVSLKADKDSLDMVFVAEPFTRVEKNKAGIEQRRAYFPVVTPNGLQVWGVGKRITQDIHTIWPDSDGKVFTVTRNGSVGDSTTTYTIEPSINQDQALIDEAKTITQRELIGVRNRVIQSSDTTADAGDC